MVVTLQDPRGLLHPRLGILTKETISLLIKIIVEGSLSRWGGNVFPLRDLSAEAINLTLVQLAIDQGIGGLLYQLLSEDSSFFLDKPLIFKRLRSEWLKRAAGQLARGIALSTAWPSNAPAPLLIKGVDLEENVYPRRGLGLGSRSSSDWDILLPSETYHAVFDLWHTQYGPPISPKGVHLANERAYEYGFYIEGLLFELHSAPCPSAFNTLSSDEIYERSSAFVSSWGQSVRCPSYGDRLLIWLINFAKSGGALRLLDWFDLCLILDGATHNGLTTEELNELVKAHHLSSSWGDAKAILFCSSLSKLAPKMYNDLSSEEVHLRDEGLYNSLCRFINPSLKQLYQIKYCSPHLRAEYIRRALLRAIDEKQGMREIR